MSIESAYYRYRCGKNELSYVTLDRMLDLLLAIRRNDAVKVMLDKAKLDKGEKLKIGFYEFKRLTEHYAIVTSPGTDEEQVVQTKPTFAAAVAAKTALSKNFKLQLDIMKVLRDGTMTTEF